MNEKQPGFIKSDLREALYVVGTAGLGIALASIFSTQIIVLIASAVIGMTLGKILARMLRGMSKRRDRS